jgi:hypothetical protein
MPGLDKTIIDAIDENVVFRRIHRDLRSDFIHAPHFNLVFAKASEDLWGYTCELLNAGKYQPELPITISVPKPRGFSRPGSILQPIDRAVYQALADVIAPTVEAQIDRSRSFSQVLASPDDSDHMFVTEHAWDNFQEQLKSLADQGGYFVKADVANYFERIPQHHLVNLLTASGCESGAVKLLEKQLSVFQEIDSFGIIQGVFPSDMLGNFYLSGLDAECDIRAIPSVRFVDDVYLHFDTESAARIGMLDLIEHLRKEGLHLNEAKSKVLGAEELILEETEIDRLFDEAQTEIEGAATLTRPRYGFTADWEFDDFDEDCEEDEPDEDDIYLASIIRLYESFEDYPNQSDKIDRFCLPYLSSAGSGVAIERALAGILERPYLARTYLSYLAAFSAESFLSDALQDILTNPLLCSDYQRMYLLATLSDCDDISISTINLAINMLRDASVHPGARALAGILAAKKGTPSQRRAVRLAYEDEISPYVRSALLYSSRYFTAAEKKTCIKAWGGHSFINSLVSKAIREL